MWLLNDEIFYHVCNLMQPKAGVFAARSLFLQCCRTVEGKGPQFGTATKKVKSHATPSDF